MHYAVCRLVGVLYIVICNNVRLIVELRYGTLFLRRFWFLVTQTDITKFFSASRVFSRRLKIFAAGSRLSRYFRDGGGLAKSLRSGGG